MLSEVAAIAANPPLRGGFHKDDAARCSEIVYNLAVMLLRGHPCDSAEPMSADLSPVFQTARCDAFNDLRDVREAYTSSLWLTGRDLSAEDDRIAARTLGLYKAWT